MAADTKQRLCAQGDLLAIVEQWNRWTVDEQGCAVELVQLGHPGPDPAIEWECRNCGEFFTVEDKYDESSRDIAWQAALDHLKPKPEVVVEVSGGVAEVSQQPAGVVVRIIDHDNEADEAEAAA